MKNRFLFPTIAALLLLSCAQKSGNNDSMLSTSTTTKEKKLFLDVHDLGAGHVAFADVAEAHKKDLAVQGKYDVNFIKFWVDEAAGKVYCLSEAPDEAMIHKTHQEAHGLLPDRIELVTDGPEASVKGDRQLFWDIHKLGPGSVTAQDVAGAHEKDLATQGKYNVSFINYWVDEKAGLVMCLSEAPDSLSVIKTHTEAHGLVPSSVARVKEGN